MITFARQVNGAFADLHELEMFLTTQALIGIGLGIAISRQQQLANNLRHYQLRLEQELQARRALMEQLVHTEEDVKKPLLVNYMMKLDKILQLFKFSQC